MPKKAYEYITPSPYKHHGPIFDKKNLNVPLCEFLLHEGPLHRWSVDTKQALTRFRSLMKHQHQRNIKIAR